MKSYDLESLQEGEKRMWERMQPALKTLQAQIHYAQEAANEIKQQIGSPLPMIELQGALSRAEDNVLFHSYQRMSL